MFPELNTSKSRGSDSTTPEQLEEFVRRICKRTDGDWTFRWRRGKRTGLDTFNLSLDGTDRELAFHTWDGWDAQGVADQIRAFRDRQQGAIATGG